MDKHEEFKKAYDAYPTQDNEGYQPDRAGFKCGFGAAWNLLMPMLKAAQDDYRGAMNCCELVTRYREALEWIADERYKVVPSHWDAIAREQSAVARRALARQEFHSISPELPKTQSSENTVKSSDDPNECGDCFAKGAHYSPKDRCAKHSSDDSDVKVLNTGEVKPLYRHAQVAPLVAAVNAWLDVGTTLSFASPQFKALRAAVAPFNSKERELPPSHKVGCSMKNCDGHCWMPDGEVNADGHK